MILYPVRMERDDNGTWMITCPTLTEVITFAEGEADWHQHAQDAVEEALAARLSAWDEIPIPDGNDLFLDKDPKLDRVVRLSLQTTMKLMLFMACRQANVTRAELARRLAWHREQVDRLFRLDHASRIDQIDAAMQAVGKTFDIEVAEAA